MEIYMAINTINNKRYIGLTTRGTEQRIKEHYYRAKGNDRYGPFYNAIRKHGWNNFQWVVIDRADTLEELSELEIHYIREYNTVSNGYNLEAGGFSGGSREVQLDVRRKISQTLSDKGPNWQEFDKVKYSKKGKSQLGSKNSMSKLDETKVAEIKLLLSFGLTYKEISNRYGVGKDAIGKIKRGERWVNVPQMEVSCRYEI